MKANNTMRIYNTSMKNTKRYNTVIIPDSAEVLKELAKNGKKTK